MFGGLWLTFSDMSLGDAVGFGICSCSTLVKATSQEKLTPMVCVCGAWGRLFWQAPWNSQQLQLNLMASSSSSPSVISTTSAFTLLNMFNLGPKLLVKINSPKIWFCRACDWHVQTGPLEMQLVLAFTVVSNPGPSYESRKAGTRVFWKFSASYLQARE